MTWRGWRSSLSSARPRATRPARRITGPRRRRCTRSFAALCQGGDARAAPCMWCPISWGRPDRRLSKVGIELTDSLYVVLSMRIMTRMGEVALRHLGSEHGFQSRAALHAGSGSRRGGSSPIFRRITRSFPSARITAGTCCWARNASRCGSAPTWRGRRAGLPSTCSFWGWNPRGGEDFRGRRLSQRLREDEFRHDDPARAVQGLEDLDGGGRHRLDEARMRMGGSTPSIPRPATSASCRARIGNRIRMP